MTTFLRDKEVTTRKRHVCCWCGEWIGRGYRARSRVYNVYNEGLVTDYMHPECYDASDDAAAYEGSWIEWETGDYRRGSTEPR